MDRREADTQVDFRMVRTAALLEAAWRQTFAALAGTAGIGNSVQSLVTSIATYTIWIWVAWRESSSHPAYREEIRIGTASA
jgi:plasmid stabilization system protein ParE